MRQLRNSGLGGNSVECSRFRRLRHEADHPPAALPSGFTATATDEPVSEQAAQTEAPQTDGLTSTEFSGSAIGSRARSPSEGLSAGHQTRTWVSSSSRIRLVIDTEFFCDVIGYQTKIRRDRDFVRHAPGSSWPAWATISNQAGHRLSRLDQDYLIALQRLFDLA